MNRKQYENPLGNQVHSLPAMVDAQVDYCFSQEVLQKLLTMLEASQVRKIYITGCGDSIAAAGAMEPAIRAFTGIGHCHMVEPMEFARYLSKKDLGIGEPNSPLVAAISAGGNTSRVVEVLKKANEIGAFSMALTNNGESAAAQNARRVFLLNTPKMKDDFPGLRSYFASMTGLIALACRIGHVRGILPPGCEKLTAEAIREYVHSYEPVLEEMDRQMFELAGRWKDFERFEFIGDGAELYSALFAMEKFVECTGGHTDYDDSENWCHIGYHVKDPATVGTVLFADKMSAGYTRARETAAAACGIGRPLLVITNGEAEDFPEASSVCRVPAAKRGWEWMLPLMDYAPAAILAGYCCTLAGRKFFNEYDPLAHEYNGGGRYFNSAITTMKNSRIEIHL